MREVLAQDDAALRASLLNGAATMGVSERWITTAAQMGMGFILPFALVFVAIPLESFIQASRTVLGILAVASLRALSFLFTMLANMSGYIGRMLTSIYDLLIFLPLWIEQKIPQKDSKGKKAFQPLHTQNVKEA
ncbi:MAG: hypothetical protein AUK35_08025 [Zetaproteobacteria bacterium CG2_30_46_52]|nr:MAG: hypothetical protein AUK35_08025 [Zetaproteobacteria bacterium CG2_30_46_52]